MKKIKSELVKVLKEIYGKKWKKAYRSVVKIKDGDIIGLSLWGRKLTTLPRSTFLTQRIKFIS